MSLPAEDAWEQLMLLKGITETTGVLHEAQILQLKLYPHVAIPKEPVDSMEIDVKKKRIVYVFKNPGHGEPEGLDRLRTWVEKLLGEDWEVGFRFQSIGKQRDKKRKPNGRRTRKARS